jgi:hypothetical protein
MGDFNDHGTMDFWRGLSPFKTLRLGINDELKNTSLKLNTVPPQGKSLDFPCEERAKKKSKDFSFAVPPKTCCVGQTSLRLKQGDDRLYGDYILTNMNNMKLELPDPSTFEYNANINPTSDHLPIIGTIPIIGR